MLYEIRNYHYEPRALDAYRKWARERAIPYIREHLDVLGFWVNRDEPAEIGGQPLDALGSATVTWIIRWPDRATRDQVMSKVFQSKEWEAIMADNPGRENYLRTEAKFADQL